MWGCEGWRQYNTITNVKLHIREVFSYRRSLTEHQLLGRIRKRNFSGYVQCDIEVPEKSGANFANFPPIFKNTFFSRNDIGDLMEMYAEEEGIKSQPRKMMTSGFTLQNGPLIIPLLLFYVQLGLVATKIHGLLSTLQRNISTAVYRGQWTQKRERTKIQSPV